MSLLFFAFVAVLALCVHVYVCLCGNSLFVGVFLPVNLFCSMHNAFHFVSIHTLFWHRKSYCRKRSTQRTNGCDRVRHRKRHTIWYENQQMIGTVVHRVIKQWFCCCSVSHRFGIWLVVVMLFCKRVPSFPNREWEKKKRLANVFFSSFVLHGCRNVMALTSMCVCVLILLFRFASFFHVSLFTPSIVCTMRTQIVQRMSLSEAEKRRRKNECHRRTKRRTKKEMKNIGEKILQATTMGL